MMGKQQDQPKLFYSGDDVNLEKRVRRENPLRAIKAGVDFSLCGPWWPDITGTTGTSRWTRR